MKHSKVLHWALAVSIIIVLNLFFHFAVNLVYEPVRWEDFCRPELIKPLPVPTDPARQQMSDDPYRDCQREFEAARAPYDRNVFIAFVVLGLISLVIGFYFTASGAVSMGLSFGGVVSFVIAAIRYWTYMEEYLRVIVLGLALATLIWLGVKKLRE